MDRRQAVALAIGTVVLMQGVFVWFGMVPVLGEDRLLADPDCYMRLLQTERLWETGDWFGRLSPLTNAPHGDVLHWTRPFDVLLLAGAFPLGLFMDRHEALFLSGVVISPLLQVATLLVLWWGARGLFGSWAMMLAAILVCLQPVTRSYYLLARPDHHSLQLLLFAFAMAGLARLFSRESDSRMAWMLGAAGGLGLWVSPEGLLVVLVVLASLGLMWLWQGNGYLQSLVRYTWSLALAVTAGLVLDRGMGGLWAVEYDRISIVHWTLIAGLAATWSLIAALPFSSEENRVRRLAVGVAGAAIPALIVAATFPKFFAGPFVEVHPEMDAVWLQWISEVKPLLGSGRQAVAKMVFVLGPVPLALGWCLHALRASDQGRRGVAVIHLASLAIFVPLALFQVRWASYVGLAVIVPWTALLAAILRWDGQWPRPGRRGIPLRAPVFLVALLAHFVLGVAILGPEDAKDAADRAEKEQERTSCRWALTSDFLQELARDKGRRLILMSHIHQGPEIAYRTGQAVVGSPYQRNHAGVLDTHAVLDGVEPDSAREMLALRGVDYLVLCRHGRETKRYLKEGRDTLIARLLDGRTPPWLRPVPAPKSIAESFLILEPLP